MKKPAANNLKALISALGLNTYQKGLAFQEFDLLMKYIDYLESKFNLGVLSPISNCLEFKENFNGSNYCKKCGEHQQDQ